MLDKVVFVAANSEKAARDVGALYLAGDNMGAYENGHPFDHRDDISETMRTKYKNVYRVVQEAGHRGKVRYLVDRPDVPPYANGDKVHGMYSGRHGGSTLSNGLVVSCTERPDRPGYWTVKVDFQEKKCDFTVTGKGKDANGYLKRGPMTF
jgi:hypothetical protein